MSKINARKNVNMSKRKFRQPTWDELIESGQAEISKVEKRLSDMRKALATLLEMRDARMPFARISRRDKNATG